LKTIPVIILLIGLSIIFFNCKKDNSFFNKQEFAILSKNLNIPEIPFNYSKPILPSFLLNQFVTIQNNTPNSNPITDWGATLGRILFYDKNLSINHTIACATCHSQQFGFTDTAQFSMGFLGAKTSKHSMALANATYYANGRFFWDERAASLEAQVLQPLQDSVEMGMTLPQVVKRLQSQKYYPILFKKAFADTTITTTNIAKALSQFVRSMISYTSKYDQGRAQVANRTDIFPNYTTQENEGKTIFMSHAKIACFSCHNTDAFITDNPRNNGLSSNNKELGIAIHTKQLSDVGKFKSSSLKNVALRKRFMHDGSIGSLVDVIEHYNSGIVMSPTLDVHLMNGNRTAPLQMKLTQSQKDALLAFLNTLTDQKMLLEEKFSNPFF
jgi:cytochrome c peroxidase